MAKQAGPYYLTGCYDDICFYKMDGIYYARMKSSLMGKRVKKDVAFKETMRYAALLASASKLASRLYRALPKESKGIAVYRKLTGEVMQLLKQGKTADEVLSMLNKPATAFNAQWRDDLKKEIQVPSYADMVIAKVFANGFESEDLVETKFADEVPP
jgi:hypothetical protein